TPTVTPTPTPTPSAYPDGYYCQVSYLHEDGLDCVGPGDGSGGGNVGCFYFGDAETYPRCNNYGSFSVSTVLVSGPYATSEACAAACAIPEEPYCPVCETCESQCETCEMCDGVCEGE
ncbi:MAG: hypothetical protein WC977_12670, partial [Anaerovoracaceae bacterium]